MKKQILTFWPQAFFFLFSIFLNWTWFRNLGKGEFIFSGDQLLRLSFEESFGNAFFIRKMDYFGVFNSWQQVVQFWDELFYLVTYRIGLPLIDIERLSFFLAMFLSLILGHAGLRKLSGLFRIQLPELPLVAVTLWYCFNPYTLVLWHGGIYNLGLALTYALAPLILFYFHRVLFQESYLKDRIICALLMFFASFTFWLFAALAFFLACYSALFLIFNRHTIRLFLRNAGLLLVVYIPLISMVLFALIHEHRNNAGDLNAEFIPSFGSQQGGLRYQLLMLFSWGIYTVWTPRALYPFGGYFLSPGYTAATLLVYGLIGLGLWIFLRKNFVANTGFFGGTLAFLKEKTGQQVLIFLALLGLGIFFAKGAQDPLGGIFIFLYNHVPFFSVFRSADHRFGFVVVFAVSMLLLFAARSFPKYIFSGILLALIFLQVPQMFDGTAVRGENRGGEYYDRITHVSEEYGQVADFINRRGGPTGYVMTFPSVEYGHYILDGGGKEHHIGQDILPKLIQQPFVYVSGTSGMDRAAARGLISAVERKDYQRMQDFPIRYVILRKDIECSTCPTLTERGAGASLEKLFENGLFSVYELPGYAPLADRKDAFFAMVNPVNYRVSLTGVDRRQQLDLMLSFNKGWQVFLEKKGAGSRGCPKENLKAYSSVEECLQEGSFFGGGEWKRLFQESLFDESHSVVDGYANTWEIDPEFVKRHYGPEYYLLHEDGSIDIDLTLYYAPQSWYFLSVAVSLASFLACVAYLIRVHRKERESGSA